MSLFDIGYTSYTIVVCLAVACFWLISLQEPRKEQKRIMIMSAVAVVQTLGYWLSIQATDLQSSIFAQKLIMCGGAFMFYAMLFVVCSVCDVKVAFKVKCLLLIKSAFFCIIFANFDNNPFVYKEVVFTVTNGLPRLELTAGVLYYAFVVMIFAYIFVFTFIIIKAFTKAKTKRKKFILSLLLVFELLPTFAFIYDKNAGAGISLIPIGYMISESIIIFLIYFLKIYDVKNLAMVLAFNNNEDGIIIVDNKNNYQDANTRAKELIPKLTSLYNNDSILNVSPITDAIILDDSTAEIYGDGRLYLPKIQQISKGNKHTGNVIWLKDITLERKNTELAEAHRQMLQKDVAEKTELLEKAEAATRSKSEFLAKMSHEIRTPMNAIVGMAELCLRESSTPETKKYATSIKQASGNLLTIINDILDFSKIESGKLIISTQNYCLNSLINDVISIISVRVIDKSLMFAVNVNGNLPAMLIGDEIRIRQIMLNLLGNAVKYTKEGYIKLTVGGEILTDDTATLKIEVEDTGIGIKDEDMQSLFGEFSQFDNERNRGVEGTGLGLAIAKNLCITMGGSIDVKSVYEKGSTFSVTLPQKYPKCNKLAEVQNKDLRVIVYESREIYANSLMYGINNLKVNCTLAKDKEALLKLLKTKDYSHLFFPSFLLEGVREVVGEVSTSIKLVMLSEFGEGLVYDNCRIVSMPIYAVPIANVLNDVSEDVFYKNSEDNSIRFIAPKAKILVVDDIITNLKVAEGLLSPFEMQIDVCERGYEAINLITKTPYDIVFMDHMMPEMDGVETTTKIRELNLPYAKTIPIVALTANAVSGVREMFLSNGFDDFLSKPIEMTKMIEILERYIPKEKIEQTTKKARQEGEIPFEIKDVDVKKGIATVGGNKEQYINILQIFLMDGTNKLKEIDDCLNEGDVKLYTTNVHALKSVLAGIGAGKLSEIAKSLEFAGKQENIVYIKDTHDTFTQGLSALLAEISSVVGKEESMQTGEKLTETEETEELLRLKNALQDYNATAVNSALNRLKSGCNPQKREMLAKIEEQVALFEYEEAETLLDALLP